MERYDLMGIPYATQAEAIAGLIDNKAMTPLKTKQSIQENAPVKTVNGKTGDIIVDSLPPGTIIAYAGDSVPDGFIDGSGAAVSRKTYERLFNVFGTKYGAGDGSTTFNLPNLNNNSFLEGSTTAGTVKSAGLPNIRGSIEFFGSSNSEYSATNINLMDGVFDGIDTFADAYGVWTQTVPRANVPYGFSFNANLYNTVYSDSVNTVQPKSVTVKFCIKY